MNRLGYLLTIISIIVIGDGTKIQANDDKIIEPNPAASMAEFCLHYPRKAFKEFQKIPTSSDWFEVYQITDSVIAIFEPHQWQEVISYLILGEDKALLFDTGNGIANIKPIVESLTDKPIIVLNSHSHYDHVGGNYAFTDLMGMDTNFTHLRQAGMPNDEIAIEVSPAALCRDLPKGVTESNHISKPYKIQQFIPDRHKIDLGNKILEVRLIPGHTPDSIILIDRSAGLMWTGDSFYEGPIWLYADETDLTAYQKSIELLISEIPNLKALLPAHNTPWVKPTVLYQLKTGFEMLLSGDLKPDVKGEGMVEYTIPKVDSFSFLMRAEPIPYQKKD